MWRNRLVIATFTLLVAIGPALAEEDIACVQQRLAQFGYDPGPVDGVLGQRTQAAARAFAGEMADGSASFAHLAPLESDSAGAWCRALAEAASTPAFRALSSPARYLLSADVLSALASASKDDAGLCRPVASQEWALGTAPVKKISGLNSRQDNVSSVAGASEVEKFAGAFGAEAVYALASGDEQRKRKLLTVLARWAEERALLETISCVDGGNLNTRGKCTEWRDPEGRDPSGMKDATFATFIGAGLVRAYYVSLADTAVEEMKNEHAAIQQWVGDWSRRLKRPTKVYFGLNMGWYWPSIVNDLATGRKKQATRRMKDLETGMLRLINADGSIVDRTTRGDRALWYHYTSIGEIVVSMELMRAAGIAPSQRLEERLHKAVALFLAALEDESILDKWARQRRNSRYAGKQDWNFHSWPNNDFAGTWLHIYPYRYPDLETGKKLRALVPVTARSAVTDIDLGLGLGCLYNIAARAR